MHYRTIKYSKIDRIGIIVINHLFDPDEIINFGYEMQEICSVLNEDDDVRLVVISGIGNNNLLVDLSKNDIEFETADENLRSYVADAIMKIEKPVVVEIDGEVFGSALEIILSCDIRIASKNSSFGMI
jgi:enoyl-CoA hydratase